MIYAMMVVQNGMPDILRAIESVYYVVDKTFVLDCNSRDGTSKFLQDRKDIYNLEIYKQKYTCLKDLRNWMMKKIPKNSWVVVIDADEQLTQVTKYSLRMMVDSIPQEELNDPGRKVPYVIAMNHWNLIKTMYYVGGKPIYHYQKCFYYDRDLVWYGHPFHAHITYKSLLGTGDEGIVKHPAYVEGFGFLHYARLDPKRLKWRKKVAGKANYGDYKKDGWFGETNIYPLPPICYG